MHSEGERAASYGEQPVNKFSHFTPVLHLDSSTVHCVISELSYDQLRMTNSGTFIIAERSRRSDGQCR